MDTYFQVSVAVEEQVKLATHSFESYKHFQNVFQLNLEKEIKVVLISEVGKGLQYIKSMRKTMEQLMDCWN